MSRTPAPEPKAPAPTPDRNDQEGPPIGTGTPLHKQPLAPSSGQGGAKKG